MGLWGLSGPMYSTPPHTLFVNPDVHPHSMLTSHCKDLEKLSTSFIHKLDPADWPGAKQWWLPCFFLFLELKEREEEKKEGGGRKWIGPVLLKLTGRLHPQILFRDYSHSTPHPGIRGPVSLISTGQEVRFQPPYPPLPHQWICLPPDEIYSISLFAASIFSLPLHFSYSWLVSLSLPLTEACTIRFSFFTRGPAANIRFQKMLCFEQRLETVWNGSLIKKNTIRGQRRPQTLKSSAPLDIFFFYMSSFNLVAALR